MSKVGHLAMVRLHSAGVTALVFGRDLPCGDLATQLHRVEPVARCRDMPEETDRLEVPVTTSLEEQRTRPASRLSPAQFRQCDWPTNE